VGSPGQLQHSARILCSPRALGPANSSGGASVPAFLDQCQESRAQYTRSWLLSMITLEGLSGLHSICCSNTSSTSLSMGDSVDSTGRGRRLLGESSPAPLQCTGPFSSQYQGRCVKGTLGPLIEEHPTLHHPKCGFYSFLCWVSFPSFPYLYSRKEILSLTLPSFEALGKLHHFWALKHFNLF